MLYNTRNTTIKMPNGLRLVTQFFPPVAADVDECDMDNGGCDQVCENTEGSFLCSCHAGHVLAANHTCVDEDECAEDNGGCQQVRRP